MKTFLAELNKANSKATKRRWVLVLPDQLNDAIGPLASMKPSEAGVILLESEWFWRRRPYHRQKLALVFANQRHFALEQAKRGVAVRYIATKDPHRDALTTLAKELPAPFLCMEPAEWEMRAELAPLVKEGLIEQVEHDGWLTTREDFRESMGEEPPYRMDAFYRHIRRRTGILMTKDDKPIGGKYSFDGDNREAWNGKPAAPALPRFALDPIKEEVLRQIEEQYAEHPGKLDRDFFPATKDDANALWQWALAECMEHFGAYEDAMSTASTGLFHTRISPLMNLHRILPATVLEDALAAEIPLNSKEGFIRQVIGWREFVRHIHDVTDGFRRLPDHDPETARQPGDGGYKTWSGKSWKQGKQVAGVDGGALPDLFETSNPLVPAYWGKPSGMNCLDTVVSTVWEEGWSHHITRLMILGNIATLLDLSPRELTDWFWVAYTDAWDWVVEPNVLGMATFSIGDLMTTKPYVAGSAYINKMSNYCGECRFSPTGNCPIKRLYWAFLARHEDLLRSNQRMFMIMNTLNKRSEQERALDREVYETTLAKLSAGEELRPEFFPKK